MKFWAFLDACQVYLTLSYDAYVSGSTYVENPSSKPIWQCGAISIVVIKKKRICLHRESNTGLKMTVYYILQSYALPTELSKLLSQAPLKG